MHKFGLSSSEWATRKNRLKFLDAASRIHGGSRKKDFYKLKAEHIIALGGAALLKDYFNSVPKLVLESAPDFEWEEWRFAEPPASFWKSPANWRKFMSAIATRYQYLTLEGWYGMSLAMFSRSGGDPLIKESGTLYAALEAAFPEHHWEVWRFQNPSVVPETSRSQLHRGFFDSLAKKFGHSSLDDWYETEVDAVHQNGGSGILQSHYKHSLSDALREVYPDHEWLPWRFKRIRRGYWKKMENQKRFFDWVATKLGIGSKEDWYGQTGKAVSKLGGSTLLGKFYGENLYVALKAVYPDHPWAEWKFVQASKGFWNVPSNQRIFLQGIQSTIGVSSMTDWYHANPSAIRNSGGSTLLRIYKGSLPDLLASAFPEHPWLPWRFFRTNANWWNDHENQKVYILWAASQLGISRLEDWYSVNTESIRNVEGSGLLSFYGDSLVKALVSIFPAHKWHPYKFGSAPGGWWTVAENRRACLIDVGRSLGVTKLSDWYNVSSTILKDTEAHSFFAHIYGMSLYRCLQDLYPEFTWYPWKFRQVPQGFWADQAAEPDVALLGEFIRGVEKDFGIGDNKLEWYRISDRSMVLAGLSHVVKAFGSLSNLLSLVYPDISWDSSKFKLTAKKSMQMTLVQRISELFPDDEVEEEATLTVPLGPSSASFELDVLIRSQGLAFELQGQQHFEDVRHVETRAQSHSIDVGKAAACAKVGITLVQVHFSWDGSKESLRALIVAVRPELFPVPQPSES